MLDITMEITGKTPLLCKAFTSEEQMAASEGVRNSSVGDRGTPKEIAESRLYIGSAGDPIIPAPNLYRAIVDGGKFFKNGKSKVTTQKSSLIPACLEMEELELPIIHKDPWEVDTRPVRIPSTGGRVLCHRPCFHDWKLRCHFRLDQSVLSAKLLRDIVDAAGSRIGLGDFRPDCKGPFGKFVVTLWDTEEQ